MAEIAYLTDLVKTLIDEVKTLRVENQQLHQKFDSLQEEIKTKRRVSSTPKVNKEKCVCKTLKGTPCKNSCLDGKTVCAKHDKPAFIQQTQEQPSTSTAPPQQKKTRTKKPVVKKVTPTHNHPVDQPPPEGTVCQLCETHGDIFDPDMPDADFEDVPVNGQSLEERLRIMLESEGE